MVETSYQSSPVGNHITCTFIDVPPRLLFDHRPVLAVIQKNLLRERYGIESVAVKYFSKLRRRDGKSTYTMVLLLSESHISIHGYEEYGTFAFDFYTCRGRNAGHAIFEAISEDLDLSYMDHSSKDRTVKFK